jgi:hypothetical protein
LEPSLGALQRAGFVKLEVLMGGTAHCVTRYGQKFLDFLLGGTESVDPSDWSISETAGALTRLDHRARSTLPSHLTAAVASCSRAPTDDFSRIMFMVSRNR